MDLKYVLVVDDDADIRELIRTILSIEGYKVVEAANGLVALRVLGALAPDLIILDLNMPVMSGPDFIRAYQQTSTPRAPIVVMTANPGLMRQLDRSVIDHFLTKPFDVDELLAVVQHRVTAAAHGMVGPPTQATDAAAQTRGPKVSD